MRPDGSSARTERVMATEFDGCVRAEVGPDADPAVAVSKVVWSVAVGGWKQGVEWTSRRETTIPN